MCIVFLIFLTCLPIYKDVTSLFPSWQLREDEEGKRQLLQIWIGIKHRGFLPSILSVPWLLFLVLYRDSSCNLEGSCSQAISNFMDRKECQETYFNVQIVVLVDTHSIRLTYLLTIFFVIFVNRWGHNPELWWHLCGPHRNESYALLQSSNRRLTSKTRY